MPSRTRGRGRRCAAVTSARCAALDTARRALALEHRQPGRRAAEAAGDGERVTGARRRAQQRRRRLPEQGDVDRPAGGRGRGVAADDDHVVSGGERERARVEGLDLLRRGVLGQASATRAQRGRPPIAAMSERFTASAFQPRSAGSAQRRRKWTSFDEQIGRREQGWCRVAAASTAQSSPMPTRTPAPVVRAVSSRIRRTSASSVLRPSLTSRPWPAP